MNSEIQIREMSEKVSFFPEKYTRTYIVSDLQLKNKYQQIEVESFFVYKLDQKLKVLAKVTKVMGLKLRILDQLIVILDRETQKTIQIVTLNFNIRFKIIQQEQIGKTQNKEVRHNQVKFIKNRRLKFSFKDLIDFQIEFLLINNKREKPCRFIEKLGQMVLLDDNFHKVFKGIRNLSKTHTYALIKSTNLVTKKDVTVKAYRKDIIEEQIWRECQLITKINKLNGKHILNILNFFQSSNSVYIIFQPFDYFLQTLSQKLFIEFQNQTSICNSKKISHVLSLFKLIIETVLFLHKHGFSMCGLFTEDHLSFVKTQEGFQPLINPYSFSLFSNEEKFHQNLLEQKITQFKLHSSSSQIIPPEHFDIYNLKYLQGQKYFEYLKRSDVFGLGNVLHMLLFNVSVFGNRQNIHTKNSLGHVEYSQKLKQIKQERKDLVNLIHEMTEIKNEGRISLECSYDKLNEILDQEAKRLTTKLQLQINEQSYEQKGKTKKIMNQKKQAEQNLLKNKRNSPEQQNEKIEEHIKGTKKVKQNHLSF